MKDDLKDELKTALLTYQTEESEKQQQTITRAKQALTTQVFHQSPLGELWNQLRYLSLRFILVQLFLTVAALFLISMDQSSISTTIMYCMAFSVLLCLTTLPELMKSFTYSMWQIEQSCRFDFHRVLLMRCFALGLVELMLLVGISSIVSVFTSVSFLTTIIYFVASFAMISGISLTVVNLTNAFLSVWGQQAIISLLVFILLKVADLTISVSEITFFHWLLLFIIGSSLTIISLLIFIKNGSEKIAVNS
ncbi:hypothetical protein ACS127_11110 [Amphibacillus sp. Q70]|uniref:hypothetical protein n=1 Tax=Amphibacillus sp. Q70 TaxID=3453416 RepID=UPI003F82B7EB